MRRAWLHLLSAAALLGKALAERRDVATPARLGALVALLRAAEACDAEACDAEACDGPGLSQPPDSGPRDSGSPLSSSLRCGLGSLLASKAWPTRRGVACPGQRP